MNKVGINHLRKAPIQGAYVVVQLNGTTLDGVVGLHCELRLSIL